MFLEASNLDDLADAIASLSHQLLPACTTRISFISTVAGHSSYLEILMERTSCDPLGRGGGPSKAASGGDRRAR